MDPQYIPVRFAPTAGPAAPPYPYFGPGAVQGPVFAPRPPPIYAAGPVPYAVAPGYGAPTYVGPAPCAGGGIAPLWWILAAILIGATILALIWWFLRYVGQQRRSIVGRLLQPLAARAADPPAADPKPRRKRVNFGQGAAAAGHDINSLPLTAPLGAASTPAAPGAAAMQSLSSGAAVGYGAATGANGRTSSISDPGLLSFFGDEHGSTSLTTPGQGMPASYTSGSSAANQRYRAVPVTPLDDLDGRQSFDANSDDAQILPPTITLEQQRRALQKEAALRPLSSRLQGQNKNRGTVGLREMLQPAASRAPPSGNVTFGLSESYWNAAAGGCQGAGGAYQQSSAAAQALHGANGQSISGLGDSEW